MKSLAYFTGQTGLAFEDAILFCESKGAELASIHSEEDFSTAMALCQDMDDIVDGCWIGLTKTTGCYSQGKCNDGYMDWTNGNYNDWSCGSGCVGGADLTDNVCQCACIEKGNCSSPSSPQFKWIDGTLLDYGFNDNGTATTSVKPWAYGEPNSGIEHCINFYSTAFYYWNDNSCEQLKYPVCNDAKNVSDTTSIPNSSTSKSTPAPTLKIISTFTSTSYYPVDTTVSPSDIGADDAFSIIYKSIFSLLFCFFCVLPNMI